MANGSRIEDEPVVRLSDLHLPHVFQRMVQRRPDVIEKRTRGGNEVVLAGQAEPVERQHLEVPRQTVVGRVNGEGPAIVIAGTQHFGWMVAVERLVKLLLRGERLDGELAGREVQKRETESGNGRNVVVRRLVEESVLGHGAGRHDARHLAADQSLRKLRILHLVAERGGLARPDQLRQIRVQRMIRNAAHRLVSAVRQRRPQNRRRNDCILAEHFVEVAEAEHHDRARGHLAFDCEVLSHHRCQFCSHFPISPSSRPDLPEKTRRCPT